MKTLPNKSLGARRSRAPAGRGSRARGRTAVALVNRPAMRIKSVLVPLDFSPAATKALTYAAAFARHFKARLTLVHVIEPVATPDFVAAFPLHREDDQLKAAAKVKIAAVLKQAGIPPALVEQVIVRFGRSFHEIADVARLRKVDLIIIATHGYTGLKHAFLGSTTERVVRHAPCEVLVLKSV